ncbi:MAG: hypothetical protein OXB93_02150 [Cytophagales bacterium]|nr:hypothetical protein [Cytophagales bacterium]
MRNPLSADITAFITEYQYLQWKVEHAGIDVSLEEMEHARQQIPDGCRQLTEADDKPLYIAGLGFNQNIGHFKERFKLEHPKKK